MHYLRHTLYNIYISIYKKLGLLGRGRPNACFEAARRNDAPFIIAQIGCKKDYPRQYEIAYAYGLMGHKREYMRMLGRISSPFKRDRIGYEMIRGLDVYSRYDLIVDICKKQCSRALYNHVSNVFLANSDFKRVNQLLLSAPKNIRHEILFIRRDFPLASILFVTKKRASFGMSTEICANILLMKCQHDLKMCKRALGWGATKIIVTNDASKEVRQYLRSVETTRYCRREKRAIQKRVAAKRKYLERRLQIKAE